MPTTEGIHGPDQLRWCGCGDHILEVIGRYYPRDEDGFTVPDSEPYEYSHMPLCPTCEDRKRRGEPFGASLGSLRRESAAA